MGKTADFVSGLGWASGSWLRRARPALAAVVLALAVQSAPEADAQRAQGVRTFRLPGDCRQTLSRTVDLDALGYDAALFASVARECANAPEGGRGGLAYAHFYAGQANRLLGEGPVLADGATRALPDEEKLNLALQQFRVAAGLARSDDGLRRLASLEEVRVHRLLGRLNSARYADALALLRQLGEQQADRRSMLYERAMVFIDQDEDGTEDDDQLDLALQDLQVFTSQDTELRRPNLYVRSRGPLALANLAKRLGNLALERRRSLETTRQALAYFSYAEQAYDVLIAQGVSFGAGRESMYVDMGMLHLQRSRLLGSPQGSSLECGEGADLRTLEAAERNFAAALALDPGLVDAHWGMGCSLTARGTHAAAAVTELQRAVALLQDGTPDAGLKRPRADYHLTLALALARERNFRGAEASFNAALDAETDNARDASIHFEAARIYRQSERTRDENAAAVLAHLNSAIAIRSDAAARLLRAEITLVGSEDLDHGVTLRSGLSAAERNRAREDLTTSLASAGADLPRVNYLLSLLEELAPTDRRARGLQAVTYATAAYRSDRGNRVYRRQACVTRITFGYTAGAESPCAAEQGAGYAEDLLFEGLFWLRDAYDSRRNDRVNDWALAINAFDRGLTQLNGSPGDLVHEANLGDLLAYGKRFAFYCMGADAANAARPGDTESREVRAVFTQRYGLAQCWR